MSKRIWYYNTSPTPVSINSNNVNNNSTSTSKEPPPRSSSSADNNNQPANLNQAQIIESNTSETNNNEAQSNQPNSSTNNSIDSVVPSNKTRETVQKVYRLIERSRTASTSSSFGEDVSTGDVATEEGTTTAKNSHKVTRNQNSHQKKTGSPSTTISSTSTDKVNNNEEQEESELAKLRCTSVSSEVISEREQRRRKRACSDYPGLALGLGGGSIFGSDTMMRLSLIKNELHNVISGQLRRTENELTTFNKRVQLIETDLETSKESLSLVTNELTEALKTIRESENGSDQEQNGFGGLGIVGFQNGNCTEKDKDELDSWMEVEESDDVSIKEVKTQIKLIAEESDKIYNEAVRKLLVMEKELEKLDTSAREDELKIWQELRLMRRIPTNQEDIPETSADDSATEMSNCSRSGDHSQNAFPVPESQSVTNNEEVEKQDESKEKVDTSTNSSAISREDGASKS